MEYPLKNTKETKVSFFKKDKSSDSLSDSKNFQETNVSSQLKKISDQLVFLEKKIDTLLGQSRPRGGPSSGYRGGSGGGGGNRDPRDHYRSGGHRSGGYSSWKGSGQGNSSGKPFPKKYPPQTPGTPQV